MWQVVDGDLSNVRIIAFRRMSQMDLSGNVITSAEFLPTLKVVFYRDLSQEDSLDAPTSKVNKVSWDRVIVMSVGLVRCEKDVTPVR